MGSQQQPQQQQQQARKRVWLSWSSGKDCCWTLHTLQHRPDVEVVGLLTTLNSAANRVAMHAVRQQLLREQAAAVGLPVHEVQLPSPCTNEAYEAAMSGAIEAAKAAGVEAIAFGDLFLEDVRAYRERMMAPTGLATLFPLWLPGSGRNTATLAREMQAAGVRAVLTCVDPKVLPASFAGRQWDAQLLAELPEGVDPCGERGEFHTFVWDGPTVFAAPGQGPLAIKVGRSILRDGFVFADVLPADYDDAAAAREADEAEAEAAARAAAAAAGAAGDSGSNDDHHPVCPPPPPQQQQQQ